MGEETKMEKLARVSGKATSTGLETLAPHGFDLRRKLSTPINRVPRRAPSPEPPWDAIVRLPIQTVPDQKG